MSLKDSLKSLNEIDVNDLDLNNLGSWPAPVKVITAILLLVVVLVAGYFMHVQDLQDELTRQQAAAISEVTTEVHTEGRGDGAKQVRRTRIKLADKRRALMDLAKLTGLGTEKSTTDSPALTAMVEAIRGAVSRTSAFPIGDAARRARLERQTTPEEAAFPQEKDRNPSSRN